MLSCLIEVLFCFIRKWSIRFIQTQVKTVKVMLLESRENWRVILHNYYHDNKCRRLKCPYCRLQWSVASHMTTSPGDVTIYHAWVVPNRAHKKKSTYFLGVNYSYSVVFWLVKTLQINLGDCVLNLIIHHCIIDIV